MHVVSYKRLVHESNETAKQINYNHEKIFQIFISNDTEWFCWIVWEGKVYAKWTANKSESSFNFLGIVFSLQIFDKMASMKYIL